jgi:hypothetical protein
LHLPPEKIQQRQLRDLQHARQQLRLNLPGLEVHTLFARKREDRVQFFDVGKTAMVAPALTQAAPPALKAPGCR